MGVYQGYELLYCFFFYSIVIPISVGLVRWRWLTWPERWAVLFLVALLSDEILSFLCIMLLHMRNHFLFHIQTVTVLCTVAGVYSRTIGTKWLPWQIAIVVSILTVIEVIFWVGFNHINTITLTLSRLLPAIYAVITLNRIFSTTIFYSLTPKPIMYIHIGFFVIGVFTAINACFMNYFMETSLNLFFLFQNMSAMMSTIAFGFFSFGLLKTRTVYMIQKQ